jgi:hypothetical protein
MLAALTLALSACSGDGATAPDAALTPEQAAEALEALSVVSTIGFGGGISARMASDMPAATAGVNESAPCPAGGTTSVRGTSSVNEATGAVTVDIRQDYTRCAVTVASNRTWTFNGDPDIRFRFTSSVNASTGNVSLSGTQVGAVRFTSGAQSGRCSIDLSMSITETTYSISGRVCGQQVSETISFVP